MLQPLNCAKTNRINNCQIQTYMSLSGSVAASNSLLAKTEEKSCFNLSSLRLTRKKNVITGRKMKQMSSLPPRLKGRSLNVLWCIIWNIQRQPKMGSVNEREAGLAVVIAPVMSCGYRHRQRRQWSRNHFEMMEAAEGAGERERGGRRREERGHSRRLLSCSLHHVFQQQLCMHTESETCPELVEGVDTPRTTQRRGRQREHWAQSVWEESRNWGVNCHV